MIFIWFFKLILFCLKRFVAYLTELEVLIMLTVLFLILLFLIYWELKESLERLCNINSTLELHTSPDFWNFFSIIIPGIDRVSSKSVPVKIGRISLN